MNCDMCKVIEQIEKGENPWFVKEFETGYVIFGWNQHFYGYVLFICKECVTELWELPEDFRKQYLNEMVIVAKAVKKAFCAEKMNYECLGNGDAHLHFHLFPRVSGDLGKYGNKGKGPVWWLPPKIMWDKKNIPDMKELEEMKEKLLKVL
ncbi:MAG: HIT family protein [Clostridia bacterium]|nr:HIT family protein [Clostridia bacterium]